MRSEIAASELSTAVGSETESALGFTGYRDYIAARGTTHRYRISIEAIFSFRRKIYIERGDREGIIHKTLSFL